MKASQALHAPLTKEVLVELFIKRVDSIDWKQAAQDVLPFLKDKDQIKMWSASFFKELIQKIHLSD